MSSFKASRFKATCFKEIDFKEIYVKKKQAGRVIVKTQRLWGPQYRTRQRPKVQGQAPVAAIFCKATPCKEIPCKEIPCKRRSDWPAR